MIPTAQIPMAPISSANALRTVKEMIRQVAVRRSPPPTHFGPRGNPGRAI